MTRPLSIYIIAGEASGDILGAELMCALKRQHDNVSFHGIGGYQMYEAGLMTLFPMEELSLMGFAEILPHALRLKKRIKETIADVKAKNPDILITIDSPGFTFRVAKALHDHPCTKIHYVAPTVWAYKPERAKTTAELFDHLLTILPFEAPYFEEHNLPTTFVGHPAAWNWRKKNNGLAFRERHNIADDTFVMGVMPGSRKGEIKQLWPVFARTLTLLHSVQRDMHLVIPIAPHLKPIIEARTKGWKMPITITCDSREKKEAFAACDVALAKSGTVTIEAAMTELPLVTCYKVHPLTAMIVKRLIQTKFVNLINILLDKEVIPELLQEKCRTKYIAPALEALISDKHQRALQISDSYPALVKLGLRQERNPADIAAETVLKHL